MRDNEVRAQLEQHHEDAFGWALSCCGWDRPLAEDVLQTAYLKVLDGRATFAGRSSLKTWLFSVIRLTASEQRRRAAVRRLLPLTALKEHEDRNAVHPVEALARSERTARLLAALKELPRRQRELLQIVFYHELTIREAAEATGVSLGTARTHYERGKKRLRRLLAEEHIP